MAYIDQDVALEALDKACDRLCPYPEKNRAIMCGYCSRGDAIRIIEGLAAADVRENKHGHWTATPTGDYRCSECGYFTVDLVCVEDGEEGWVEIAPNYCSRCGAEMKGANDG